MFVVLYTSRPGVTVPIFTFEAKDPDEAQRVANYVLPKSVHHACKVVAEAFQK